MAEEPENIGKFFGKYLNEQAFEFNEAQWQALEQRLDAQDAAAAQNTKGVYWWQRPWVLLLLLLLTGFTAFWLGWSLNGNSIAPGNMVEPLAQQPGNATQVPAPEQPATNGQPAINSQPLTVQAPQQQATQQGVQPPTTSAAVPAQQPQMAQGAQPQPTKTLTQPQGTHIQTTNKATASVPVPDAGQPITTHAPTTVRHSGTGTFVSKSTLPTTQGIKTPGTSGTGIAAAPPTATPASGQKPQLAQANGPQAAGKTGTTARGTNALQALLPRGTTALAVGANRWAVPGALSTGKGLVAAIWPDTTAKPRYSGLIIDLQAAPDFSATPSGGWLQEIGHTAGLRVQYQWASRWAAGIGASLDRKLYTARGEEYQPLGKPWTVEVPERTAANCLVLEVPVTLSFALVQQPRRSVWISTSLHNSWLLTEQYEYWYAQPGPDQPTGWMGRGKNNHWLSAAGIALMYEQKLSPRLGLTVQPYFRLPLKGFGHGAVQLYGSGVHIGMRYHWPFRPPGR